MDHYSCLNKYHGSDNCKGRYDQIKIRETRGKLRATVRSQIAHLTSHLNTSCMGHNEPIHYQLPTHSITQRYESDISKIKLSAHDPSL
jgi:hypothetical protein